MTVFDTNYLDQRCRCGHTLADHFPQSQTHTMRCEHSHRCPVHTVHYCGCDDFVPERRPQPAASR